MRIKKYIYVESDRTCCYTGEFNAALSLYGVLGVALYFFKSFLKTAARRSAVAEVLWSLGQESNLQSSIPQQRHRLFSRCFLHLSLVNLPLLASLEERSTYRKINCLLGVKNRNGLEDDDLANKTTRNIFVLFWKTAALLVEKALPCFQK